MSIVKYLFLIILVVLFLNATNAYADNANAQFNRGLADTAFKTGHLDLQLSQQSLAETIGSIIKIILSLVGVFFLLLMIYGGYIWMMARGNEQETTRAKDIIQSAIIGIVIILLAYAITYLITDVWLKVKK